VLREEGKPPTTSKLQQEKKKVYTMGELLYKNDHIQDTWNVFRFDTNIDTQYIEMEDFSEKNFESEISTSINGYNKPL
ncbi:4456_t:CDS:2, partial [Racocetra fulgida]